MIIDSIDNAGMYSLGRAWDRAFDFLKTLDGNSEDKKYRIDGDDIFAIVMSYETQTPLHAILESHREYVDIQTVITGGEGFECFFTGDLDIQTPYDAQKDITLYRPYTRGQTRVDVYPGTFVMLYPHDAHMAGLIIGENAQRVKKVVVKVRKSLLGI